MKNTIYKKYEDKINQLAFIFSFTQQQGNKDYFNTIGNPYSDLTHERLCNITYGLNEEFGYQNDVFCENPNAEDYDIPFTIDNVMCHLRNFEEETGKSLATMDVKILDDDFNIANFTEMFSCFREFDIIENAYKVFRQVAQIKIDYINENIGSDFTVEDFEINSERMNLVDFENLYDRLLDNA